MDGSCSGRAPRSINGQALSIDIVGGIAVPVGVLFVVKVPRKRAALAQTVGRCGSIEGQGFAQRNRPAFVVVHGGSERGCHFQTHRHAQGLAAITTAQWRFGVVDHQEQLFAFERGWNLPGEGTRLGHALQGGAVKKLDADAAGDVTIVHGSRLQVNIANEFHRPCRNHDHCSGVELKVAAR